jgi:hypothetical protein
MAILNFPDNPLAQPVYVAPNGITYTYDSTSNPGIWRATTTTPLAVSSGSISGNPVVGATLTYTPGVPSGGTPPYAPASYQWKANGVVIGGVVGTSYVVDPGNAGQSITVTINVQDSETPAATASATTAPLTILNAVTVTAGSISSNSPVVDVPLTYTPGTASGGTGSYNYAYQWKANGTAIGGATSTSFTPTSAEVGQTLTVTITATDQTYPTLTANATTSSTSPVVPADIPSGTWNPSPNLSTEALAASSGTWNGPASTVITASGCIEVSTDGSTYGPTVTVTNPQVLYQRWKESCVEQKSTDTITGSVAAAGVGTNNYLLQLNHIPTNSLLAITSSNVPLGATVSQVSTSPISGLNAPAYVTIAAAGNTGTNIQAATAAGGPWTTLATTGTGFQIVNGQTLYIQQTVGGSTITGYVAKIQVGDNPAVAGANFVAFDYTATTTNSASFPVGTYIPSPIGGPNASPDTTNLSGPALVGTASGTWNGVSTSISTTGDLQYKINTGSWGQTAATVNSTDTLALRWDPTAATAAADAGSLTGTLTGTISGTTYTNSYTLPVDKQPAAYTWTDVPSGAALSTQVSSNIITISDINCPAELTITAPGSDALSSVQASINGGTWTNIPTSSPGLAVDPADTLGTTATQIQIRGTTGGSTTTAYTITTNIGKGTAIVSDTWSVTTTGVTPTVNQPSITAPSSAPPVNPALNSPAGITLIGSPYADGPTPGDSGGHGSSDWEVFGNLGSTTENLETSAIVGVAQNAATPWTQQTSSFASDTLVSVTYGNGLYVVGSNSGNLATSPNGTTWTQQTSSFSIGTDGIYGLTYGNGLYVAGGTSGKLATSPDGITWTQRTSSFGTSLIYGVAYGNGLYVAGGDSGKIATSPDGITWTQRTSGFGTSFIRGLTYANGLFVAVGQNGKLATSPDGITWTQQTSSFNTATELISSVTYGNGLYVAVGYGTSGKLATSPDGITWTQRTSGFGADSILGVTYANGTFVAVGSSGKLATSPDAITWTQQTSSFGTSGIQAVTYGNGLFIAAGASGKLATSATPLGSTTLTLTDTTDLANMQVDDTVVEVGGGADATGAITAISTGTPSITVAPPSTNWTGITTAKDTSRGENPETSAIVSVAQNAATSWTQRTVVFPSTDDIRCSAFGNGTYVAATSQGNVATSPDGVTWTLRTGVGNYNGMTYGNGLFVAVGASGSLQTSPDGVTWTSRTSNFGFSAINSVAFGNGTFVAVGQAGKIATSTNGTSWTLQTSPIGSEIFSVGFGNGLFVFGAGNGNLYTSSNNGVSWTSRSSTFGTSQIYGVTYGNNLYVIGGTQDKLATSPDGVTWTSRTSSFTGSFGITSVAYGANAYVAVGGAGALATSPDGINWTQGTSGLGAGSLDTVTFGNGLFLAGGINNRLSTSNAPTGSTTLTLTDTTDLSNMVVGDTVVEVGGGADATGTITAITPGTPSITVAPPSTNWTGGSVATAKDTTVIIRPETSAIVSVAQNAATSWTQQTSSFGTDNIEGIAYGNSLYVAVGASGKLATSPDATTWTQQTSSFGPTQIWGVTYGNGLYVAVGESGKLATSSNGTTWTQQTSSFGTDTIFAVTYGNSLYVAVGTSGATGKIATSPDGINWTQRTSSFGTAAIREITYGNGLYVAVGDDGKLATSPDGITWTQQTSSFGTDAIAGVTYGNGLYVAVGLGGKLATSPDGITWTQRTSSFGADAIIAVTYANGIFVAGGQGGKLATSSNGTTWTQQTSSFTTNIRQISFGNNLFVAAGLSGKLATSGTPLGSTTLTLTNTTNLVNMQVGDTLVEVGGGADATGTITAITPSTPSITVSPSSANWTGITTAKDTSRTLVLGNDPLESTNTITGTGAASASWTQQTSSFGTDFINALTYANNLYVAVGDAGKIATSPDGINWTQQTSSFGTDIIRALTYGNSLYVAVGDQGKLATSPDGINWTQQTSGFGTTAIYALTYGNSLYVAAGNTGKLATSPDGINWTQRTSSFGTTIIYALTYANSLYVAAGNGGKLATSPDGITWTQQTSSFGADSIRALTYGNGLFVAAGGIGKLATSPDGITWTQQTSSFGGDLINAVTYANSLYVAGGAAAKLATSPDGINWTQQTSSFGADSIYALTYGNGLYVAVGSSGKLATSYAPAGGTSLTISGADTDGFAVGNLISNGVTGGSAASGTIAAITSTSVTVAPQSANWANGQNLYRGQTVVAVTNDSTNLVNYLIPQSSLATSTTYQARVKYNSISNPPVYSSAWSGWSAFTTASAFVPTIGAQIGGGYFAGQINDGGTIYNLIVAPVLGDTSGPNSGGTLQGQYGGATPTEIKYRFPSQADLVEDQNVVYGGTTSDRYKASADHPLFNTTWLSGSTGPNGGTINLATGGLGGGVGIGGYTDWYVPAKNELEILYFNLKPTTTSNNTSSGINPNAVPARASNYPSGGPPVQTTNALFAGGAQAFSTANNYWSSSEFSINTFGAWCQSFNSGNQSGLNKVNTDIYARAIRRVQA